MESDRHTAVVTGGASGIGRAIATRLAGEGHAVAILDLDAALAEEASAQLQGAGRACAAWGVDVTDGVALGATVEKVRATLGRIGIFVHAAGICTLTPLLQMTDELFDRTLAVHLGAAFRLTRALLPDMIERGWGRIVHVASVAGLNGGGPGLTHYAAAKGGLIAFTKALAHEVAPSGVTVNAIAPGLVDTPMLRGSGMPGEVLQQLAARTPVRRIGTPEEIAAACAFLVSPEAGFVTGQVLSPNGGAYM